MREASRLETPAYAYGPHHGRLRLERATRTEGHEKEHSPIDIKKELWVMHRL